MKYLDWLKTNPEKGYYWVRSYDCYEERIDEFTDWYDNAGNVETKFTEQPDEVISDRLTYIDYLDMVGHCGAYSEENKKLKDLLKEIRGKLHYINVPVNRHNIFCNDFIKKIDQVLQEKE